MAFLLLLLLLILHRYSDFDDLRKKLSTTFPNSNAALPPLPPKSMLCEYHKSMKDPSFS